MKYKEFLGEVHQKAHLAEVGEAVTATRATLEVLAQRLTEDERANLGAQLPEEIGLFLAIDGEAERFGLEEFYHRVSEKEGVDYPQSVHHAQVVFTVMRDAISRGEWEDVQAQLPAEYLKIWKAGS